MPGRAMAASRLADSPPRHPPVPAPPALYAARRNSSQGTLRPPCSYRQLPRIPSLVAPDPAAPLSSRRCFSRSIALSFPPWICPFCLRPNRPRLPASHPAAVITPPLQPHLAIGAIPLKTVLAAPYASAYRLPHPLTPVSLYTPRPDCVLD